MNNVVGRLGVLLLFLCVPVLPAAQTAEVDWIRGTDFAQFHTFTWATAFYPIQDPDANMRMAAAVRDELEAKGVSYVDPQQKFDVFVTYNAAITQDPQELSHRTLTIKLRIFDARNNTVIWRAGGFTAIVGDQPRDRNNVRALLATIFEHYPPAE